MNEGQRIMNGWMSWVLACLLAVVPACDESLPPREQPPEGLSASFRPNPGIVVIRDGVVPTWIGAVEGSLLNTYSEVLQGDARVSGTVEIWLTADPAQRVTFTLGPADLLTDWILTFTTVTLGVDSAAVFYRQWTHRTDSGRWFWEFVRLTNRLTPRGEPYRESDPVRLTGRATLQILDRIQRKRTPDVTFTLVYHLFP